MTQREIPNRAYSVIEVKAVDSEKREFSGWATTPTLDRMGDTIDPLGASFANPLVLLHGHRHDMPVGKVLFEKPTRKGIKFNAGIPAIPEPGPLKDRCDTAWGEIKYDLVRAVSVGFRPIKYAFRDDGGIEFQEVEIYELSIVAIPAQAEAIITQFKSMEGPLSHEAVTTIKKFDTAIREGRGIPLVSARGANTGAIKLTSAAR